MGSSFVAVDLGASSGRVMLGTFDDAFTLEEVHRFPNDPVLVDDIRCWNHEALFEETLVGLANAVAITTERDIPLRGIGVDSWGVDYGLVDQSNSLAFPARHYRSTQESVVATATVKVPTNEAYRQTGIIESPINTCFQFVRDAQAGLFQGDVLALLTPDLWNAWLTGERCAERTIASTTGLLDWATGDWAYDLMDRYGIQRSIVPRIVNTGELAGATLSDVTARIGAHKPIDVFHVGAHDTASAFAAVTDCDDDSMVISCGTWALAGRIHPEPLLSPLAQAYGFTNEVATDGSALILRNLSGTWLLDECFRSWAQEDGVETQLALRNELLEIAVLDAICVPGTIDCGSYELMGTTNMPAEINRLYREQYRVSDLDRIQTVALILQSLAQSFRDTIQQLNKLTGITAKRIVMIGGGSRIEPLVRLTSALTELPVVVSYQEATSIGNICVQATASGVFTSVREAREVVEAALEGINDE